MGDLNEESIEDLLVVLHGDSLRAFVPRRVPEGLTEFRIAKYGDRDYTFDELVESYNEFNAEGPW